MNSSTAGDMRIEASWLTIDSVSSAVGFARTLFMSAASCSMPLSLTSSMDATADAISAFVVLTNMATPALLGGAVPWQSWQSSVAAETHNTQRIQMTGCIMSVAGIQFSKTFYSGAKLLSQ